MNTCSYYKDAYTFIDLEHDYIDVVTNSMNTFSHLKHEYDYTCRRVEHNNKDININI